LFTFHVNPYYLRLNFSHRLTEDEESSAKYDPTSGHLTITLSKEVEGEEFEDLDLLAKLLAPRSPINVRSGPSIEVLDTKKAFQEDADRVTEALSLDQREIIEGWLLSF
jgi:protein SHQ1